MSERIFFTFSCQNNPTWVERAGLYCVVLLLCMCLARFSHAAAGICVESSKKVKSKMSENKMGRNVSFYVPSSQHTSTNIPA